MLILTRNGRSIRLEPQPFQDEAALQEFIAAHPEAIPLGDTGSRSALHALGREFPTSSGPLDVLATDAAGGAYIIETKLYKNPDKRLVLAQVLDYGAALWAAEPTVETLLQGLRVDAARRGRREPLSALATFLGTDEEIATEHVEAVCAALAEGRFTAIILMDRLTDRLRDLIRFMNENSRFLVLAVELDYYRFEGEEIVSPRVFGAEAKRSFDNASERRASWDEQGFFGRLASDTDQATVAAAKKVLAFAAPLGPVSWGSGIANPSMNPYFVEECSRAPITLNTRGYIHLKLSWLRHSTRGSTFAEAVAPLIRAVGLPTDATHGTQTRWAPDEWVPRLENLLAAFRQALESSRGA